MSNGLAEMSEVSTLVFSVWSEEFGEMYPARESAGWRADA